ncbi:hypothetical protein EZI54_20365 [Marinobacter halodurans]|uniref:Uncharacterized protein n=1 Tax=Marinobacter halodurans TaxID=2528979 RepID=A0ABY1ZEU3_9GAMM|nr:hypothetical protein [Marinobacter halodurans]TBW48970.1 hypothetical protein EZI54_20365 [Marinobacter halodurans]
MKFTDKLRKSSKRSRVAYLIALLAVVYFLMTVIKGMYFLTDGSNFPLALHINEGIKWIFEKTWVFPLRNLWEILPAAPFETKSIIDFYKVITPPVVVVGICALFIADHRMLREKFHELKSDIEKEIALREMRKDAGLETLSESATIDIAISNATNDDPAWHNTGWGKIVIGVAIALVVTAIGLK